MTEDVEPPERLRLRARDARPGDRAAIDELIGDPRAAWERVDGADVEIVFEFDGRIVAADAGAPPIRMALPADVTEPPPVLETFPEPGDHVVQAGVGLWIASDVFEPIAARIHRSTRTLLAVERGARAAVSAVPLPEHDPLDPAGVAQMCLHGALDWPAIRIPLEDGWWPIGLTPDRRALVIVWRNRN